MNNSHFQQIFNWKHLVENPSSIADVEEIVKRGSVPDFPYFFMLAISAVVATLGLLANSAAVIIGAMIIAPLMTPIVSTSYWLIARKGILILRSLLTVILGSLLTVIIAYLFTEAIGWKLVGTEIVSRLKPSLLDLGIALAAGAAGAFAYTRQGISSTLAGIAIAVALVPPLCTVGVVLAEGQDLSPEVGLALDVYNAKGPLLLYLTNFIGIVFAASLVFFWQYYRRNLLSVLTLVLILGCLLFLLRPLGLSMKNLLIRNQIRRNITLIAHSHLPKDYTSIRITNLSVRIGREVIYVRADIVAPSGLITQQFIDEARDDLSEMIGKPVVAELGVIIESVIRSIKEDTSYINQKRGSPGIPD